MKGKGVGGLARFGGATSWFLSFLILVVAVLTFLAAKALSPPTPPIELSVAFVDVPQAVIANTSVIEKVWARESWGSRARGRIIGMQVIQPGEKGVLGQTDEVRLIAQLSAREIDVAVISPAVFQAWSKAGYLMDLRAAKGLSARSRSLLTPNGKGLVWPSGQVRVGILANSRRVAIGIKWVNLWARLGLSDSFHDH